MDHDLSMDDLAPPPKLAPGWMVTFADLLSLLLAFFVILFATSSVDQKQWQSSISPISSYFTGSQTAKPVSLAVPPTNPAHHDSGYILALVQQTIDTSAALKGVTAELRDGAVWIDFASPVDVARIEKQFVDLARVMAALDNHIELLAEPSLKDREAGADPVQWVEAIDLASRLAVRLSSLKAGSPVSAGTGGISATRATGRLRLLIVDRSGDEHVPSYSAALLAVLCLTAGTVSGQPVGNVAALDTRAAIHDNYARLVFDGSASKTEFNATADIANGRLSINFNRPVAISIDKFRARLSPYIDDIKLDETGSKVSAHLRKPATLRFSHLKSNVEAIDLVDIAAGDTSIPAAVLPKVAVANTVATTPAPLPPNPSADAPKHGAGIPTALVKDVVFVPEKPVSVSNAPSLSNL